MTKVRLWQLECSDNETSANRINRVLNDIEEAARGVDLLVLPELWTVGAFNLAGIRDHHATDDLVHQLATAATDAGIWLHAGSLPLGQADAEGRCFNTSIVIGPNGKVAAAYRKQHLFGFADGERTVVAPGDEVVVIDTPLGRTGISTCYDLRFPELYRAQVDLGAEAFLIAAGWPTPRINHWWVLVQARAIENQALTIACNARGFNGDVQLAGQSMVVNAKGEILAQAGRDDEFLDVEVDTGLAQNWRRDFPVLADRVKPDCC